MSDDVRDTCPMPHTGGERPSMPRKSDDQKELDSMVRGALQYAARKSEDLHAPLIDLQRQQRLERSALIEIARKKGLSKQEAKIAVTLAQQVQYFELQRDILAAEDARVAAWRKEQEEMLRVHPLPWSPDPPILARASRDDKSLDYWAHEVERRSDQEFVAWLESSRLPPLRRPSGVPDFDELLTLGVAQQRIRQIQDGDDRQLQRRLQ